LWIAVQTNSGFRVEEGLPKGFNRDIRHFDKARRTVFSQIIWTIYIRGVDYSYNAVSFVLAVFVF